MPPRPKANFRLDIGPCQGTIGGKKISGKCEHVVFAIRPTVKGDRRTSWGVRTGHQIFRTIDRYGLELGKDQPPDRNLDHFRLQASANVTRTLKSYNKGPKPLPLSQQQQQKQKQQQSAAEHKARTTVIGGRRSYGMQSRRRLRVYDRKEGHHDLDVRNGVWKASFGLGAPMFEARERLIGDFDFRGFQAAGFRCIDPQNTYSVANTGEVNLTAALVRYDALITIWRAAIWQQEMFDIPIDVRNVGVVNMTASAGLGVKIDLHALAEELNKTSVEDKTEARYNPEDFPNLVYKDKATEQKLAFGVSCRGYVNVVGAKNESHMDHVIRVLFPRLKRAVENIAFARETQPSGNSNVLGKRKRDDEDDDGGSSSDDEEDGDVYRTAPSQEKKGDEVYLMDLAE